MVERILKNLPEGAIPLVIGDFVSSTHIFIGPKGKEFYEVSSASFDSNGNRVLVYQYDKTLPFG